MVFFVFIYELRDQWIVWIGDYYFGDQFVEDWIGDDGCRNIDDQCIQDGMVDIGVVGGYCQQCGWVWWDQVVYY